jgi:hypothetical protein
MDSTKVLSYLHPEPPRDTSVETLAAFARLWQQAQARPGIELAYDLPVPKWQFLSWLAETQAVVLHGSSLMDLAVVEPKPANDVREFSAQTAIYAATDGIWVIFFAILNRTQMSMALFNSAVRFRMPGQPFSPPYYLFSINREALEMGPYCDGMVYILPRDGFEQDPMQDYNGIEISVPQWAGHQAAAPLARLIVSPADFPFLSQVRAHDHEVLRARIQADPNGFPWLDD